MEIEFKEHPKSVYHYEIKSGEVFVFNAYLWMRMDSGKSVRLSDGVTHFLSEKTVVHRKKAKVVVE